MRKSYAPDILYLAFILVALVIVYLVKPLHIALIIAFPIVLLGYIASTKLRKASEGAEWDERYENASLKASKRAYDVVTSILAAYVVAVRIAVELGINMPKIIDESSIIVAVVVVIYLTANSLFYLYYRFRMGG